MLSCILHMPNFSRMQAAPVISSAWAFKLEDLKSTWLFFCMHVSGLTENDSLVHVIPNKKNNCNLSSKWNNLLHDFPFQLTSALLFFSPPINPHWIKSNPALHFFSFFSSQYLVSLANIWQCWLWHLQILSVINAHIFSLRGWKVIAFFFFDKCKSQS